MGKPWLEGFKFSLYVALPIALTLTFATNPENLRRIIENVRRRDVERGASSEASSEGE